jgi:hypothetical protein
VTLILQCFLLVSTDHGTHLQIFSSDRSIERQSTNDKQPSEFERRIKTIKDGAKILSESVIEDYGDVFNTVQFEMLCKLFARTHKEIELLLHSKEISRQEANVLVEFLQVRRHWYLSLHGMFPTYRSGDEPRDLPIVAPSLRDTWSPKTMLRLVLKDVEKWQRLPLDLQNKFTGKLAGPTASYDGLYGRVVEVEVKLYDALEELAVATQKLSKSEQEKADIHVELQVLKGVHKQSPAVLVDASVEALTKLKEQVVAMSSQLEESQKRIDRLEHDTSSSRQQQLTKATHKDRRLTVTTLSNQLSEASL